MTDGRSGRLEGVSILIVEDEMLLAMEYEQVLVRHGCTVVGPTPRQATALTLLETARPDAVLLDLNLDGDRPVRLAETLTARDVPFLIVTGYSALQTEEPVFRAAPRLDKPVNAAALVDALVALVVERAR